MTLISRHDLSTLLDREFFARKAAPALRALHLRFPVTHRRAIRTTNLLERLFGEERRRLKIIPNAFGERAVLKLMFGALIHAQVLRNGSRICGARGQAAPRVLGTPNSSRLWNMANILGSFCQNGPLAGSVRTGVFADTARAFIAHAILDRSRQLILSRQQNLSPPLLLSQTNADAGHLVIVDK